ncbi:NUDIX hydrolase [Nocardioides bruguierae]|uniref:NUDIX domain-containing protein n=1 Tax=Nocardioides bruguierae TaxID=2945102 RepID=A0A9X2D672_9ACTN|nr:NUDIX domain-containing protein [Nocardioides bruguierae]MCM0619774.1 NUDIX domain-containing protein [Nocardioides bruguierae]
MAVDRSRIRVKAFAVLLHPDGTRHAVSRMSTTEHPTLHRPLGGSVELGEPALDAAVREIREELDATLVEPRLLGVLENVFTIDGELGHEVVFVHLGHLAEADAVPDEGRPFTDGDVPCWVEWRPVAGDPEVPLFPTGLQEMLEEHLARGRAARGT